MMARKTSLKESIVAKVNAAPPRHRTWFDKLEDDAKAELVEVKSEWLAGELKSSAIRLAEHISATLKEAGVSTVGSQGVVEWLNRRD